MQYFYVALGGAMGSMGRYALSGWVGQSFGMGKFPIGTLMVNVLGCLVVGILAGSAEKSQWLTADGCLFLFVGLMGGFTTFSAFGLETVQLVRGGDWMVASAYVAASVCVGLCLLALGFYGVQKLV
jgi:CrcB protein